METDKYKRRTLGTLGVRLTQLALASLPFAAMAQTPAAPAWPSRPVTVVVPFAPGGGTDIAGRLLIGNVGTQSINPSLYKLTYDADKAFAPISLFAELPFAFVVNPNLPAKTPKELIALAKAAPEKYTYASSGSGGSPHLTAEIFQQATGVKFVHVPYKGGGPAMSDLMAGHVDMLFASILETSGYVKTGKLRALAVTSPQRSPAMPEVPTLAELGVPNAESGSWVALLAPAGTPQALVDKIAADVKEAVATEDMRKALIAQGATPRGSTPAELQKTIDADKLRYGQVIKAGGVKVE
jgi:tripartite-type tricarboxylate transporter receptor subunit TctC